MKKIVVSSVVAALVGGVFAQAVIPGEFTDPSALKKMSEDLSGYRTPEELQYPYVSTYYVKPTVTEGESVKIGFFVTDFYQTKMRFGDKSLRFSVSGEIFRAGEEAAVKKLEQKDVPDGDGEFDFGPLPRGDYRLKVMATDSRGRESHRVWQVFRVRTAEELVIPEDKVYRMTADDLAAYAIDNDGDYGRYVQVEVPKRDEKSDWKKDREFACQAIDEYLAKNDVRNKAKRPGYAVVVAATEGRMQVRSFERCRVILDDGYDTNAVEQAAIKTAEGIQKLLDDKAAAGFRKVVMLPGFYRISAFRRIEPPDNFTLDLNGATFKENSFTGASSDMIQIKHRYDTHVVNGTVEGDYYEHDYAGSPNGSEWPMGINICGESLYCSFEKITVKNITGYGGSNGIAKKANGWFGTGTVGIGKFTAGGLNRQDGTVDESDKFRFTSDFTDVSKFRARGWVQVSRVLGYQGRLTRSWQVTGAWYDAEKKFLGAETMWQYREVPIPADAKFLRVSVEEKDVESANKAGLSVCDFYFPIDCTIKDCVFDRCRCVGYAASAMRNYLFEGNEFRWSGEAAARCAFDAEDGWDQMQDAFFVRNYFHDNPCNNSILTCAGHNFVLEGNRCGIYFWGRTHSPCVRNNDAEYLSVCCDGRLRSGYMRVVGNKLGKKLEIFGVDKEEAGWYTVVEDLDRMMKEVPLNVSFGKTGKVVGGTYADAEIKFGSLVGATLERTKTTFHTPGKWIGVVAKDIKIQNLYETNVYERCEFFGGEIVNIGNKAKGRQTFVNCIFHDTKFYSIANANAEFRDCVFESGTLTGSYWTPASLLLYTNCTFKLDGKPYFSIPQWNIGRVEFAGCKVEAGEKESSFFFINDARASRSDDDGGSISFRKCSFDAGVKSVITSAKSSGAKRPLDITAEDNEFADKDAKLVDPANFLPCWTYPGKYEEAFKGYELPEDLPGAVSMIWTGKEVLSAVSGYADIAAKRPVSTNDLFWLASNTKAIACALMLREIDKGLVKLDAPVADYLPEWKDIRIKDGKAPTHAPTVRELMGHKAGLAFFPKMPITQFSVQELAHMAVTNGLDHDVGEHLYSNWGIDVAMAVVESVTGEPWEKTLKSEILDPLGMKDATFFPTEQDYETRMAKSYRFDPYDQDKAPEEIKIEQLVFPYDKPGAHAEAGGGLFGTAMDLLKFFRMVADHGRLPDGTQFISEGLMNEWYGITEYYKDKDYTFGTAVKPQQHFISHGGAYNTNGGANWKRGTVRIFLTQISMWTARSIERRRNWEDYASKWVDVKADRVWRNKLIWFEGASPEASAEVNTKGLNQAIAECQTSGLAGEVTIPKGVYKIGDYKVPGGVILKFEDGAKLEQK